MLSFAAIDFETANSNRASACSLGITKVINGKIQEQKYEIFKPPSGFDNFDSRNIQIHGIRPETVTSKPRFAELWDEFRLFIGDLPLIAHNASFDLSVLRATLLESDLSWPELEYACTMVMSRHMNNLASHSLLYVAHELEIEWDKERHHDALYDSEICAKIAIEMALRKNSKELKDLLVSLELQMGMLFEDGWYTCRSLKSHHYSHHTSAENRWKASEIKVNEGADPTHPLYGKIIVFTGKLYSMSRPDAWQLVASLGATPKESLTKSTNMLVVGEQDPQKLVPGESQSSKFREAEKMLKNGSQIEIISETDFLAYLEPSEGSR